mgnify:CR=1 FL=1
MQYYLIFLCENEFNKINLEFDAINLDDFKKEGRDMLNSKKLTRGLLIVYLAALIWIIIFKMQLSFQGLPHLRNINLIPFAESMVTNGKTNYSEIINNAAAFIPFGIFMGMLLQGQAFFKKVAPVFLTSLAFEVIQFVFSIGASDITDLLANTFGGLIGIGFFFLLEKIFKRNTLKILNLICLAGGIILVSFIGLLVLVNL